MAGVIGPAEGTKPRRSYNNNKIASFRNWRSYFVMNLFYYAVAAVSRLSSSFSLILLNIVRELGGLF